MKAVLKLFLLFLPIFSFTQVTDSLNFKKVLKQLNLKETDLNLNLATDKILPYENEKTIFALPKYHNRNETDG